MIFLIICSILFAPLLIWVICGIITNVIRAVKHGYKSVKNEIKNNNNNI